MKKLFCMICLPFLAWQAGAAPGTAFLSIEVSGPDQLASVLLEYGESVSFENIGYLKIKGDLSDNDFDELKEHFAATLHTIDLSEAWINDDILPVRAFSGYTSLTTVHLNYVEEIEEFVFEYCSALKHIYFYDDAPPSVHHQFSFNDVNMSELTFHVPLIGEVAYDDFSGEFEVVPSVVADDCWGVTVILRDSHDNPVTSADARVRLYRVEDDPGQIPHRYGTALDFGEVSEVYELEGPSIDGICYAIVPVGAYIVSAENVSGYLTTYYSEDEINYEITPQGVTQWADAAQVNVWIGEAMPVILPLVAIPSEIPSGAVTIDGYVYYDDKQKARVARNASVGIYYSKKGGGASKRFEPDAAEWTLIRTVQPDEDAYYIVQNLPAGRYLVVADIPGYDLTGGYTLDAGEGETIHDNNFFVNDYAQVITISDNPTSAPTPENATFRLYPNPFKGALQLADAAGSTLTVTTLTGATVHTQKVTRTEETVHLGHLPAGLYLFRLEKDGKTKTMKIVKND